VPDAWEYREPPDRPRHPPTEVARPAWRRPQYSQTEHIAKLVPRMPEDSRPAPGSPQPAFTPQPQRILPRRSPEHLPPRQPQYGPPQRANWPAARKGLAAVFSLCALALVAGAAALILSRPSTGAAAPATAAAAAPVSAVPGSNGNEYVTGPFTVTLKGIGPLPPQYDAVNMQGQRVPENCAVVDVKNTSASYTGWAAPHVEFVKGHSMNGQLLGTAAADPTGGSSGGSSDPLSPGQSEVLYACPQDGTGPVYVQAQLTSITYGTPDQGTLGGTTVQLKY
jgi:hypothetical protein